MKGPIATYIGKLALATSISILGAVSPNSHLQRLDTHLGKMDFKEESRTLGKDPRLRASVWKVPSDRASQNFTIHSELEVRDLNWIVLGKGRHSIGYLL